MKDLNTFWLPGFEPPGHAITDVPWPTVQAAPIDNPLEEADQHAKAVAGSSSSFYRLTREHLARLGSSIQRCLTNVTAIQTLKRIECEGRSATPQEQATLALYCGWGGMPQAFDPDKTDWAERQKMLREAVEVHEWESARASTPNAYYTSIEVIQAIYRALERIGCHEGRILEPSAGTGYFLGAMPEHWQARSQVTCVEVDSISARIGAQLYPDARWHQTGIEQAPLPAECWDVVLGNVPFGDYSLHDPVFNRLKLRVHDYFFAKALSKLRPGALLAFVTSTGTMDKLNTGVREYLAHQADFLGAIRLPSGVFQEVAKTHIAADILFLRKKHSGERYDSPSWSNANCDETAPGRNKPWVNEYFLARPEMVIGSMSMDTGAYGRPELKVTFEGDLEAALNQAIAQLPTDCYRARRDNDKRSPLMPISDAPVGAKNGTFVLHDGRLAVCMGGVLKIVDHEYPAKTAQRICGLLQLRDVARAAIDVQVANAADAVIAQALATLNATYAAFVLQHGYVHDRANRRAFKMDPDLPLLLSLEIYDADTERATKADMFGGRTIFGHVTPTSAESPQAALIVSLRERGKVDLGYMSKLRGDSEAVLLNALVADNLIYENPLTGQWQMADAYLSGNVRTKLDVAQLAMNERDGERFERNVRALQSAQPRDLLPGEISARLGSPWIPAEVIQQFVTELLEQAQDAISVFYSPAGNVWAVEVAPSARGVYNHVLNTTTYGTVDMPAVELVQSALNLQQPTVYDETVDGKRIMNVDATEAARSKQHDIAERFKEWLWRDPVRAATLAIDYNQRFNGVVLRQYDGSHLQLPGMSNVVKPYPHQLNAIWRTLQAGNTLLGHCVGAGKSFAMIASAMELRRLGIARKPMFAVLNSQLEDFAAEFLRFYPAAKLLVVGKEELGGDCRREMTARIATGNWDAVIVTHATFERVQVDPAFAAEFMRDQLDELDAAIAEAKAVDSRVAIKQMEVAKKRLVKRLASLSGNEKKDKHLNFSALGIDWLFVDEAHLFKNLFFITKMNRIAGLPNTASQRALDLLLKCRYLQQLHGGQQGAVFATGTPLSNSMAEIYTMQRFLQPDTLARTGLAHFDAWAACFGEPVTALEIAPDGGGYRVHTRFARFVNVPELTALFGEVADIQTQEMLQLPVPAIAGGGPQTIVADISPAQKAYVDTLVERAARIHGGGVNPKVDNMLAITSAGRKAALDIRLVAPAEQAFAGSKVNLAVRKIVEIWQRTAEQRSTQLVFCDLSVPTGGRGFSVYEDVRDSLVAQGLPATEIAFIQDYDSDTAKAEIFQRVRTGKVRILLGSTARMGMGVNVQRKLVALHDLDAPWRPADMEQRLGRGVRQGNENTEIEVYRYVTNGTFDSYMYQTLERKQQFIAQVIVRDAAIRTVEDAALTALSYAEVKALASGNPLVLEKAGVDAEVLKLTRAKNQWLRERYDLQCKLASEGQRVPRLEAGIEAIRQDLATRQDVSGQRFAVEIEGRIFTSRLAAGQRVRGLWQTLADEARDSRRVRTVQVGQFAGFVLELSSGRMGQPTVCLRGQYVYETELAQTDQGVMQSIEYALTHIERELERETQQLVLARVNIEAATLELDRPFAHELRLRDRAQRQREIDASLQPEAVERTAGVPDAEAVEELAA